MKTFSTEVTHRRAQQQYSLSLTAAQRYVLRELRALYSTLEESEEDLRSQISVLEGAFKQAIPAAIKRLLNVLRRNGVTGTNLLSALTDIYHEHGMSDFQYRARTQSEAENEELPRIICSEALV